jgi:transcriptional regulator with XRE-family HTH domain
MADGTISLASMILEARAALGLSTAELGERLDRSAGAIEAWERGEAMPDPEAISALAIALELDARDLADAAGPDLSPEAQPEEDGRNGRDGTTLEPSLDDTSTAVLDPSEAGRAGSVAAASTSSAGILGDSEDRAERLEAGGPEAGGPAAGDPEAGTGGDAGGFGAGAARGGEARASASSDVWTDLDPVDPASDGRLEPPIGGVRADPEIPEPVRPAGVTPAGVDPLDWVRRGATWIRNRWRRRHLLARAPTAVRSYVEDDRQATTYRIRQVLTAVALIALVLLLRWAWGQFAEAVSSLFDTMRSAV